jgi:hypothetical protein
MVLAIAATAPGLARSDEIAGEPVTLAAPEDALRRYDQLLTPRSSPRSHARLTRRCSPGPKA